MAILGITLTAFSKIQNNKAAVDVKITNPKKEVKIGTITYSFRSMPDQSAESILKYVIESGVTFVELKGDHVEYYAGKPKSAIDHTIYKSLKRKQQKKNISADELEKLKQIEAEIDAYKESVIAWRSTVPMDKFKALRKKYNDAGISIYAFKPNALKPNHTDAEIGWAMRVAKALGATHVTVEMPNNAEHTQRLADLGKKHKMRYRISWTHPANTNILG